MRYKLRSNPRLLGTKARRRGGRGTGTSSRIGGGVAISARPVKKVKKPAETWYGPSLWFEMPTDCLLPVL